MDESRARTQSMLDQEWMRLDAEYEKVVRLALYGAQTDEDRELVAWLAALVMAELFQRRVSRVLD